MEWNEIHIRTKGRRPIRCYVIGHFNRYHRAWTATEEKDDNDQPYIRLYFDGKRKDVDMGVGDVKRLFEAFPSIQDVVHTACSTCRKAKRRNCRYSTVPA